MLLNEPGYRCLILRLCFLAFFLSPLSFAFLSTYNNKAALMPTYKKAQKQKKRRSSTRVSGNSIMSSTATEKQQTWVDTLEFRYLNGENKDRTTAVEIESDSSSAEYPTTDSVDASSLVPTSISVVTWNSLAEAYCTRRSHTDLPRKYQNVVFDRERRLARIIRILKNVATQAEVICMQEVDQDEIGRQLKKWGYHGIETPRMKGGGGGRVDSCIVYAKRNKWQIVAHEMIHLDDLATLSKTTTMYKEFQQREQQHIDYNDSGKEKKTNNEVSNTATTLQGLQRSFLRRNMALIVRLKHVETGETVVLINTHLYWNPEYEYVKLCQTHYILQRAKEFRQNNEPFVFCGDFNSRPNGITHRYLTRGSIESVKLAPWYTISRGEIELNNEMIDGMSNLYISTDEERPKIRYLLDATLNQLCRWLRILGIDAALETDEQERMRTKDNNMIIFDRCRQEKRTLITTSTRLMHRTNCPAGAYCINPSILPHLEVAMVHLLLTHAVVLEPESFLSRCVVCNGNIAEAVGYDERIRVLKKYDAPKELGEGMEVFECQECGQGYWWCDRPSSSASRVKNAATKLFEMCLQAGVPYKGGLGVMTNIVDAKKEQEKGWDFTRKGSELLKEKLDVVGWMNGKLENPIQLCSAYASKSTDDDDDQMTEDLPFTNVTSNFTSTIDYVMFDKSQLVPKARWYVPTTREELNTYKIHNGHLLPSDIWPSDHLLIGCSFELTKAEKEKIPDVHTDSLRCACGCVPKIKSLFEMAELRKMARAGGSEKK